MHRYTIVSTPSPAGLTASDCEHGIATPPSYGCAHGMAHAHGVVSQPHRVRALTPPFYQATGRDLSERNVMLGWYSSAAVSPCKEGKRSARALKASWPSSRARVAPRQ